MKKYSTLKTYKPLKRGKGFKKTTSSLKRSGFNRTLNEEQKEIKEADQRFSKQIIKRDGKCLRCGSTSFLTCSHWEKRANFATRYIDDNCITLCVTCHDIWESKKNGEYKDFMIELLGIDRFEELVNFSKMRISKETALDIFNKTSVDINNNDIQY